MKPNEFVARWTAETIRQGQHHEDRQLITAPRQLLHTGNFPDEARQFLVDAGLPKSCIPFLSFNDVAQGPRPLVELYGQHNIAANDSVRLAGFYVLGSDGAGNPICLDPSQAGAIVLLDHEDRFRTSIFVTSSVMALAEALLLFHTVPLTELIEQLRRLDPPAAEATAFFPQEVAMLL